MYLEIARAETFEKIYSPGVIGAREFPFLALIVFRLELWHGEKPPKPSG